MNDFPDPVRDRHRARLRRRRRGLRRGHVPMAARALARQRAHAGDLRRRAGGRAGLPEPPVHDHRHGRRGAGDRDRHRAQPAHRDRLRHRRHALRRGRVHRHERLGPRERPRRRGRPRRRRPGAQRRLPRRRGHRPAGGRPGASGRGRLLRHPAPGRRAREDRGGRPDRPRLRRLADLGLRATGRRHLHQGRRRRRRPRRQGGGGHPRGRPAQPRRDRRQRRRQRRRLRRNGRRPVRDLRGHGRRRDAPGRPDVRQRRCRGRLPARDRRRVGHRLDHRHLRRAQSRGQRRAGALPGPDRLRRDLGRGLLPDHQVADEGPVVQGPGRRQRHGRGGHPRLGRRADEHRPVAVHADRDRHHGVAVRDHRLLHLDALPPGADHRPRVPDRPRDQHHPGALPRASSPRPRRRSSWRSASSAPTSSPASTASAWP